MLKSIKFQIYVHKTTIQLQAPLSNSIRQLDSVVTI